MAQQSPGTRSQTLDRGIQLLESLAEGGRPMTISQLVDTVGLHRSIVYRLLRTLEDRRLVSRDAGDTYRLGFGLVALTRGLVGDLGEVATADLRALADRTDLAAFIVVQEADEALTVLVVEPRSPSTMFTQRIGYRHPVSKGAPGAALLALAPESPLDRAEVRHAREHGWALTYGEVMPGVTSVAAPLGGYRCPAAVAVTWIGERPAPPIAVEVVRTAGSAGGQ